MNNLWSSNTPAQFWQTASEITREQWQEAAHNAMLSVDMPLNPNDLDAFLYHTLGEGRFGSDHWDLSAVNRIYWFVKPVLPTKIVRKIRGVVHKAERKAFKSTWPVDDRYIRFEWETMRQLLLITGLESIVFKDFWPNQNQFSFVLTHDVESVEGQSFIPAVADLEEKHGVRSLFNIVGDQIPKDLRMLRELEERGFEIGLHGWHHDSKFFESHASFSQGVKLINESLRKLGAVGYRSPLNLRHPEWMQELAIEYDLSFFDTDPFEPIPGGTMSIWPIQIGHFIELPQTLLQDNTLVNLLGEDSPRLWLEKVNFIRQYHGMALLNTHPDYLKSRSVWNVYASFLEEMRAQESCWRALPRDAARWWRFRTGSGAAQNFTAPSLSEAALNGQHLVIR